MFHVVCSDTEMRGDYVNYLEYMVIERIDVPNRIGNEDCMHWSEGTVLIPTSVGMSKYNK